MRRAMKHLFVLVACLVAMPAAAGAPTPKSETRAPQPSSQAVPPAAKDASAGAATPLASTASKAPPARPHFLDGLLFGSYGRIGLSTDLQEGARGKSVNVVSRGPRLEEGPYAELNLGYRLDREGGMSFLFLFTLALFDDVFHYTGELDQKIAVRNFYLEVGNVFTPHLALWVGARMYRGDDIYLLDFWPLDDLNTVGAGAKLRFGTTSLQLHAGANRLNDPYQYKVLRLPNARLGTDTVDLFDRQRAIVSTKFTHEMHNLTSWLSAKVALYGELHVLPQGRRREGLNTETLPSDVGWVAGLELGAWGFGTNSYINLFVRFAGGLGAYDELAVPDGLGLDKRTTNASEARVALSANFEYGRFGVLAGGYLRYFRDADGIASDPDDAWEYVIALRPMIFITRNLHQLFEISYQGRRPDGIDPERGIHSVPGVFKAAVMPALSWDRGAYSRPQLRLVYALSYLNQAARESFRAEDPRFGRSLHHYLGVQVEWWLNSSYR